MGTFLQGGMPSKRESSARADYVPAQGTHRLSLPPIECAGASFGLAQCSVSGRCVGKFHKPYHLEEAEVVTRFP